MKRRPLLPPATADGDTSADTVALPAIEPATLMKFVAAGVLSAGAAYLEHLRYGQQSRLLPPPQGPDADVLTADEVATMLRLDRKTVYDYAGRGEIPCQRLGKRILFSRAALVSWLGGCSKGSSDGGSS